MVLLPVSEAADGWELLRGAQPQSLSLVSGLTESSAATSTGPVLVFIAAGDADAVAAVKVATTLLRADLTRYELHPVTGYTHLREKFEALATTVVPRAVLCINCGAMVDLERVLGLRGDQRLVDTDVRIFVLDCHRPYHLKNIRSERVILFDDVNDFNQEQLPLDVDWEDEWGNVRADSSSDESDDGNDTGSDLSRSDDEDDIENHVPESFPVSSEDGRSTSPSPKRKRARRRVSNSEDNSMPFNTENAIPPSDHEEQGDEENSNLPSVKDNPSKSGTKRSRKRRKMPHRSRYDDGDDPEVEERDRLRDYYSNATIAMSSACLVHSIAAVMRRSNIDTLWMAVLGVTSQYVASIIPHELYEDARGYFLTQIKEISPKADKDEGTSGVLNVGYTSKCTGTQVQRIAANVELRLDLLRHWSLHDSLLYSSYTATRLAAWRQTGKRRLLEMLATLGIPLKESQQQWCYMKDKNKKALEQNLHVAIARFDIGENLRYDSFVRSLPGHKGDVSAADYAQAINTLLEFDDPAQRDTRGNTTGNLVQRFWRAYDALDCRNSSLVETGLEMAVSVQRLTADIGGDVIERRKFVPSGPFRYAFLRDQQCTEYLSHPLLLRRLALFLNRALVRQGGKDKPFIVLAPDVAKGVWIAVAATTSHQKNDFGQRFHKAAERNGSQVTYEGFNSSVCEIQDGQESEFVRFLHDVMR